MILMFSNTNYIILQDDSNGHIVNLKTSEVRSYDLTSKILLSRYTEVVLSENTKVFHDEQFKTLMSYEISNGNYFK